MCDVERLIRALDRASLSLGTAESCTGGAIASALVSVSGASRVFRGGVVAYDPSVKERVLGVLAETISDFGVVSDEVAKEMAEGARRVLGADLAISTTGVAGPGGGTPLAPVGRVFIGISGAYGTVSHRETFSGDRDTIRAAAVASAISHLLRYLEDNYVL